MFYNIMRVLDEQDGIDSELLVFAMTLINKTLYGIPDQEKFEDKKIEDYWKYWKYCIYRTYLKDTFYDVTDALDMQNMEKIETRYREKKGVENKGTENLTFISQK